MQLPANACAPAPSAHDAFTTAHSWIHSASPTPIIFPFAEEEEQLLSFQEIKTKPRPHPAVSAFGQRNQHYAIRDLLKTFPSWQPCCVA